jgi:thermitase
MKSTTSTPFRLTLAATAALLAASFLVPAMPRPAYADKDETIDNEDKAEKAADLQRAKVNNDKSPDRLVVVYDRASAVDDQERERIRQVIAGKLLKASKLLKSDVIRVSNADAEAVARAVRALPGVKDAYPDRVAHKGLVVNDPRLADEWGLAKIQAPTAWDTSQGDGVKVAVLDCGIHASHSDLSGKVTLSQDYTGSPFGTDDRCDHGTHVAGTIAAVTNNGVGVASVAPGASLINGKVLDDTGSGWFTDIDAGIVWAAENGAKVINMSLGGGGSCPSGTQNAVNTAWNTYGTVVVAAAGNSGLNGPSAPGNCANVISVAATDVNDNKPSWSNYGTSVDVAAPGVSVLSTTNPDVNGSSYDYFSGTSMATPHTAGVAALIWKTSYGTSAAAVRDRLFLTADNISGTGSLWAEGRINAAAAVAGGALSAHDVAVSAVSGSPNPVAQGDTSTISVTVQNVGTFAESSILVEVSDTSVTPAALIGSQAVASLAAGASTVLNFPWATSASTTAGAHTITATATLTGDENATNNSKSASVTVQAPITDVAVNAVSASPSSVILGSSSTVTVTVANTGTLTANNIAVDLAETAPAAAAVGTKTVASLAPGASTQVTFTFSTTSSTPTSNHTLTATATVAGDSNAANNSKATTVSVTHSNRDVAVTAISASSTVKQGSKLNVKVTVKNEGNVSESFSVVLVDSTTGATIGTKSLSVGKGSSKSTTFSWTPSTSTATGPHELKATAGPVPTETDLADNSKSYTVTVTASSTSNSSDD